MLYDTSCLNDLTDFLTRNRLTVSVAESVTSGHLQAALSSAEKALQFFQGGITAYNAGQKTRHLMVEPIYALENDCVSEEVAAQMARGSNHLFISDYGIGITGYATKPPGSGLSELFAFTAIAKGPQVIKIEKLTSDGKDITGVQVDYTNQALRLLLRILEQGPGQAS